MLKLMGGTDTPCVRSINSHAEIYRDVCCTSFVRGIFRCRSMASLKCLYTSSRLQLHERFQQTDATLDHREGGEEEEETGLDVSRKPTEKKKKKKQRSFVVVHLSLANQSYIP